MTSSYGGYLPPTTSRSQGINSFIILSPCCSFAHRPFKHVLPFFPLFATPRTNSIGFMNRCKVDGQILFIRCVEVFMVWSVTTSISRETASHLSGEWMVTGLNGIGPGQAYFYLIANEVCKIYPRLL